MHPWYLSSSTWETVIMGDRQVTYGVLWHLWQFAQEREHRNRKEQVSLSPVVLKVNTQSQEVEAKESVISVNLSQPETKFSTRKAVQKQRLSSKVCPILIDIPAAVLAREKHQSKKTHLGFNSRGAFETPDLRSLWEDDHPTEHDLYPQPSAAPDITDLTEIEADVPLILHQEAADAVFKEESGQADTSCSTLDSSQDVSLVVEDSVAELDLNALQPQAERPSPTLDDVPPVEPASCDDGKLLSSTRTTAQGSRCCGFPCLEHIEPRVETLEVNDTPELQQATEIVKLSEQLSFPNESNCELLAWLKHLKIRISDPAAFQVSELVARAPTNRDSHRLTLS